MKLNKFNDSIFNKETLIGKLEITKENLNNPMLLNNLFVGENYSCLDDFLCVAKEWQDMQLHFNAATAHIEIENKMVEQENQRREIEKKFKKINELNIKKLKCGNLNDAELKIFNSYQQDLDSLGIVNYYDDMFQWEQSSKNKYLLAAKEKLLVINEKELKRRKMSNEMWIHQQKEILYTMKSKREFENDLIVYKQKLEKENKIIAEEDNKYQDVIPVALVKERAIKNTLRKLERQEYNKQANLIQEEIKRNDVWTKLWDLECNWRRIINKTNDGNMKLIFKQEISNLDILSQHLISTEAVPLKSNVKRRAKIVSATDKVLSVPSTSAISKETVIDLTSLEQVEKKIRFLLMK
ncbi:hypothetical protein [Spiroplasma endosymbiont of Nephrotoma flavescens]|uniref:hypothetical protein n=1 Tax=Spiroplasma endosymbiont of Nephrotoma flavescens TaxID=3066302 RepID=UPI00313CB701